MNRKSNAVLLGILALSSISPAIISKGPTEEKITLRWNVRPDQRFEYVIKMQVSGDDTIGSMKGTVHFADRVVSVNENEITQSVFCAGASIQATGLLSAATGSISEMKGLSFERVVTSDGKMKETAGFSSQLLGNSIDLVLPKKEVGVGDIWTDTFKPNEQLGTAEVTYKLVSFDAKNAKIEATLKKTDTMETVTPYFFLVDRATGRYRFAKGLLNVVSGGISLKVGFELNMIVPHSLRSTDGGK